MQFLANALRALNGIYRIQGGTVSTNRLALESDIQLVHDVSREAELAVCVFAQRMGGFFGAYGVNTGTGAVLSDIPIYGLLDTAFGVGSQDRFHVWLMQVGAISTVNAALIPATNHATLSIRHIAQSGSIVAAEFPVAFFNSTEPDGLLTGSNFSLVNGGPAASNTQVSSPMLVELPALIPPGATLGWGSNSAVAASLQVNALLWAGAIGTLPPGM